MLRTGALLIAGLLISVVASLVLVRRMVKPIRVLQVGAAKIGAGELEHRIIVATGDELEALGADFNNMTAQLQESYAGLERKVDERTRALTESLEQQTATSEILRVISQSQNNIQPVFEAIAANAQKLCSAFATAVATFNGDMIELTATHSLDFDARAAMRKNWPMPSDGPGAMARAIRTRSVANIPDVRSDLEYEMKSLAGSVAKFPSGRGRSLVLNFST